jgi:ethylmalonyl-CoA mutase
MLRRSTSALCFTESSERIRGNTMTNKATGAGASGSPRRDEPWMFRTYAGHSTAAASNALFRKNLEKGQTGLSIAFDLPTQTGYDSDDPRAAGEVGKVGVPVSDLADMRDLLAGIPPGAMNTSMTINATAPWLLALYVALADEQGVPRKALAGTTQNDILKEYLARGTYVFPPAPSLRLTRDTILFAADELPKWNPINVCSYHLQEAGATPGQELAFALATAIAVLDDVRSSSDPASQDVGRIVGRISFFVNAGLKFVTEMCKLRAFSELWDEITASRYGVTDPRQRLFRYGVQVNSLGLTEQQPENNIFRILIEMLAVTLSKRARARAVQLPAWNEALGLPRPWDQQWSLRMQQILAYETDLLDHGDIFDGSIEIERKVAALKDEAREELAAIERLGGAVAAIGYMKERLVASNARRLDRIETGEQIVVGVNRFTESEASPLATGEGSILTVPESLEREQIARLRERKGKRDKQAVAAAMESLRRAAAGDQNVMPASIACAKAGVTTGEWGATLRSVFGESRAPTGVDVAAKPSGHTRHDHVRLLVDKASTTLGRQLRILIGKPGLDGHSNGAEQIAVRARDCGMEVVYEGIRLTPAQIVAAAKDENVHLIGLSILSGSHVTVVREIMGALRSSGLGGVPVVVGGIIPADDQLVLKQLGVRAVYTPKDYDLDAIMIDMAEIAVRGAEGSSEFAHQAQSVSR